MRIKYILIILGIIVVLGIIGFLHNVGKAGASQEHITVCFCHNYKHNPHTICTDNQALINGHEVHVQSGFDLLGECIVPTNTPTPTISLKPSCTPTPTEEVSPTPTITPTPTIIECEGEDCVTLSPSPIPSVTPEVTPGQTDNGGSTGNSSQTNSTPVCTLSIDAPILQGFKATSNTSVEWSWWLSKTPNVDHQWIEYGYSKGNYPYNVTVPVNATSFEIGAQDPNAKVHWARVCVQAGACVACSEDLDP